MCAGIYKFSKGVSNKVMKFAGGTALFKWSEWYHTQSINRKEIDETQW